ncbi:MAG: glutathione S-transferase C-terminal domain-containing protein [Phenylobacterium sp.]|jgi:glutathione S-transferase|nr:glutathione S-transferase C-terminal domain-containing protein [Phenylobacterium sp.]MDZ4318578.1 glutathione S-transferase C-terminal domain-containing protein [Phenylobacterium sp.]
MPDRQPIALSGSPGSPYTRKMLALLRYRRIPYRYLMANSPAVADLPQPKVRLLPTFYLPDEAGVLQAVVDSTPLIRRLEREADGRSVIPDDPALAFLDELIEDYADEWLTKAMFHYRWAYADDIDRAARILPAWSGLSIPDDTLAQRGEMFSRRQIDRLYVVGSNPVTGPVIEASYQRFLEAFEAHLTHQPYLLGRRPGASDFAVYGQLTQLAQFDPTPMALTLKTAPRVFAWVSLMEDASGLEPQAGDWTPLADQPETLGALLAEMGRVYVPVMLANAQALADGAAEVRTEVDGLAWTQSPFPYQGKCLQWLRASYAKLDADARSAVDPLLDRSGLMAIFA